jgi:hypothetical protein
MSQLRSNTNGPAVEVKPQPNIYTVLLLVTFLVLLGGAILVANNLMADAPNGYGLSFGELFSPPEAPAGR